MNEKRKSFVLYRDQGKQIGMLTDAQAGMLIKGIFRYMGGEDVGFADSTVQMCFGFISAQLDRDALLYEEKCKRLAQNAQRAGQASAQSRKRKADEKSNQMVQNSTICNQIERDNDNDTVNDTVNDTDTVTVTVNGNDTENENDTVTVSGTDSGTDSGTERSPTCSATFASPMLSPTASPTLAPPDREIFDCREELIKRGLPAQYVDERMERAERYIRENGGDVEELLLAWWREDRGRAPWNSSQRAATGGKYGKGQGSRNDNNAGSFSSFDTDDFFEAALQRSFAMSGGDCGEAF